LRLFDIMEEYPNTPPPYQPPHSQYGTPPPPKKRRRFLILLAIFLIGGFFFFIVALLGVIGAVAGAKGRVAVLDISGMIIDVRYEMDELRSYAENPTVKAIVVRIESPGGAVAASQEMLAELKKARRSGKPVIASMGNVAASGGYYIALGADEIWADPGTLTGSIGVIINHANWEELVKKIGIRFDAVKTGEYKDIGSPTRPMTEAEKALLQDVINDVYEQFLEDILEARRQQIKKASKSFPIQPESNNEATSDSVKSYLYHLADGRIFTGRQAKNYGLVDKLGNMQDAVMRAAQMANIKGKPSIYKKKRPLTLMELIRGEVKQTLKGIVPDSPILEYRYIGR